MGHVLKVLTLCFVLSALVVPLRADDGYLKELGTIVVDNYSQTPTWCGLHNQTLNYHGFRDALRTNLESLGSWGEGEHASFPADNNNAYSAMLVESASLYADAVDLFVVTMHAYTESGNEGSGAGAYPDGGSCLHFTTDHFTGWDLEKKPGNVNHSQVSWGSSDLETSIVVACEWLRNFGKPNLVAKIKKMHQGDHLMLSFATYCYDNSDSVESTAGLALARYLEGVYPYDPLPIYLAWHDTVKIWQPSGTRARVSLWADPNQGDNNCYHDYLQGNWRNWGFTGQPPTCTDNNLSVFQFADYVVP